MGVSAEMSAEQAYYALRRMFESASAVSEGRCPKCGQNRWNDDCEKCGWHSVYVPPILPERVRFP